MIVKSHSLSFLLKRYPISLNASFIPSDNAAEKKEGRAFRLVNKLKINAPIFIMCQDLIKKAKKTLNGQLVNNRVLLK